jgi:hypothetical protein
MSVEVQTSGSTAFLRRTASLFDMDSAYTVLFRIFLPSANPTAQIPWGLSGATSYGSGTRLGTYSETLRWKSDNDLNTECFDGTNFISALISTAFPSGWNSIAVSRVSLTQVKIRANGETQSATNASFTDREASAIEMLFADRGSGDNFMAAGTRITNYKAWTAALSDAEIDAEMLTTTVQRSANFYTQSPMGDASTLANNLTQIGSSSTWTAGAGLIAGANDPSVTYATSSVPVWLLRPRFVNALPGTIS